MTSQLDPLSLMLHASGPVKIVNWGLVIAAAAVWMITVMKLLHLGRLARAERRFEADIANALNAEDLEDAAQRRVNALGARIVEALCDGAPDLVELIAKRAVVAEEQWVGSLLGVLSTIGSAGPFVGLFGTVWGILDAFLLIGREKSASLPVVAPAIGEALISTALGLFAAIPAVVAFNALARRADEFIARTEAAAGQWVAIVQRRRRDTPPTFLLSPRSTRASGSPPARALS
jgi:biopolymer transport protein TolQ